MTSRKTLLQALLCLVLVFGPILPASVGGATPATVEVTDEHLIIRSEADGSSSDATFYVPDEYITTEAAVDALTAGDTTTTTKDALAAGETWCFTFYNHLPAVYLYVDPVEIYYVDEDYGPPTPGGMDIDFNEIPELAGLAQLWYAPVPEEPICIQVTRDGDNIYASFEFNHEPTGYDVSAELSGTIIGNTVSFNINYYLPNELQNYSMPLNYSDCMSDMEGTVSYSLPAVLTVEYQGTIVGDTIQGTFTAEIAGQWARWRYHDKEYACVVTILGPVRDELLFDGLVEWRLSNLRLSGDFRVGFDLQIQFLDKDDTWREVVGATADGESQVIIQISPLPRDITIDHVNVQIMSEGDGRLENDATIEDGVFTQTYAAPEDFVGDGHSEDGSQGYREIDLSVQVEGQDFEPAPFYLFKPPVVLIHGIWSSANAWAELKGYLEKNYGNLIYPISYSNDRHFSENRYVVNKAVRTAIACAKNHERDGSSQQIVVKQADVVTHSMGGVLADMYITSNHYRNDINRVITIGTPHSGSHIANYALNFLFNEGRIPDWVSNVTVAICELTGHSLTNGAVEDLQVGSSANLQLINGLKQPDAPNVPVYAISCDTNMDEPVGSESFLYSLLRYLDTKYCDGQYFGSNDMEEAIFGTKETDFIVSCQSQRGGSAKVASEYVAGHIGETKDENVKEKVCELLNSPVSNFDPNGFNPLLLSPPIGPVELSKVRSSSDHVAATAGGTGTDNFISIVSPRNYTVYRPGETVSIEAVCEEEVQSVLFIVPWDSHEDNSIPYTTDFTIDEEFAGGFNAVAVALGNEGILGFDFVELTVEPSTPPQEIRVYPPSPLYLQAGTECGLYVQGIYSDGFVRDVTYLSTTSYGSGNPAVATASESGVVYTISPGRTTIQIENGNASLELEVIVEEANSPPNTSSSPWPANRARGVSINADLNWSGGDPDAGDTVTYDVYFGTSETPPLVSNDQSGTTYDPGTLAYTKYYWKVIATDNHGASTAGPLWDFSTLGEWDPWAYDENSDGIIQKAEALKAIQDYFDLKITKAQVLEVLQLYFS